MYSALLREVLQWFTRQTQIMLAWLVWRSGNGVGHINKVKLRRARLVLGLVTTFGKSTNPTFSWPLSLAIP